MHICLSSEKHPIKDKNLELIESIIDELAEIMSDSHDVKGKISHMLYQRKVDIKFSINIDEDDLIHIFIKKLPKT